MLVAGVGPLSGKGPRVIVFCGHGLLYALEVDKDCYVDIKLKVPVASSFRRMVRGGVKASQLAQLNDIVGSVSVSNSEDRWVWDMNGDGVFRVKDVRNLLDETFLPKADSPTRKIMKPHSVSMYMAVGVTPLVVDGGNKRGSRLIHTPCSYWFNSNSVCQPIERSVRMCFFMYIDVEHNDLQNQCRARSKMYYFVGD
ncbi:hypothetical protein Tco_0799930 [Tanacetum coccineum]|uniref:RNA-directed DNA polymerase, eukaryota, reverse transcriptase zinc-binding domain protein n=1 Tax=Tanacetum coccineum TaxID=301880 RepID=A0ABQ4ZUZ2_9ASTR